MLNHLVRASGIVEAARRKPRTMAIGAALVAVTVTVVCLLALRPGNDFKAANVSRNYRACLIASPVGATDAPLARSAWQGMLTAASTGHVNAQRIVAPTAAANVSLPVINGAVQRHCGLIVTVGEAMRESAEKAAAAHPHQHFAFVGTAPKPSPNLTAIDGARPRQVAGHVVALLDELRR
ncbi:type 1 periplasmic-binding domain-containing protein [Streptomyces mirabilis]|uniref:hypothetical protein n=1 Tax=Streptomyces mirabilis TaxID=68239 RepID=UPI0036DCDBC8